MRIFILLLFSLNLYAQPKLFQENFVSFNFSIAHQEGLGNRSSSEMQKVFYGYHNNYTKIGLVEYGYFLQDKIQLLVGFHNPPIRSGYSNNFLYRKFPDKVIQFNSSSIGVIESIYSSIGYKVSKLPLMLYLTTGLKSINLANGQYLIKDPNSNQAYTVIIDYTDDSLAVMETKSFPLFQLSARYHPTKYRLTRNFFLESYITRSRLGSKLFYFERNENTGEIYREDINIDSDIQVGLKIGYMMNINKEPKKPKK